MDFLNAGPKLGEDDDKDDNEDDDDDKDSDEDVEDDDEEELKIPAVIRNCFGRKA